MSEPRPLHRLFGLSWVDFFQGSPVGVETELDLSLKLLQYAREHYRPHSRETSTLLYELFKAYSEDRTMPDKLKEFVRQSIDELLRSLPPEELRKRLSPEERLKGLSADEVARGAAAGDP